MGLTSLDRGVIFDTCLLGYGRTLIKEVSVKCLKCGIVGFVLVGCCFLWPTEWQPGLNVPDEWTALPKWKEKIEVQDYGVDYANTIQMEVNDDIPIVFNERVEFFLDSYMHEGHDSFSAQLKKSTKYIEPMRKILKEYDLPEELVYLALIESGFNPLASSYANALGPWQLLAGTARLYGLKLDSWIDERRDPVKSTKAAARYLNDLHGVFHDWYLTLAAYNTGQYRVLQAIKEAHSRDFWVLDLPAETMDFVPRFLAATTIAKNPKDYGFHIRFEQPIAHEVVVVDNQTDLNVFAARVDCEVGVLRELNPELTYSFTPPDGQAYRLRVPKGVKDTLPVHTEKVSEPAQTDVRRQEWLDKKSYMLTAF